MLKISHVNVGAAVALGSIILTGGYFSPVIAFYPFFAVLQDADHPNSAISRMLPFFRIPGGHRGFSHTLWFAWIASMICFFAIRHFYPDFSRTDGLILVLLCHSHLMADFFTVRMLPLLYPLTKQSFGLPIITTGSIMEKSFTLGVTALNVFLAYKVFVDYWLVGKLTFAHYDKALVYGAIIAGIFTFWGLFRQEIADIRRYPSQIVVRLGKTAAFFAANYALSMFAVSVVKANYLPQVGTFLHSVSVDMASTTAVSILFGLSLVPSVIKISDSVDKTSFLFATVVNTLLVVLITALFIFNAGDLSTLVQGVSAAVGR